MPDADTMSAGPARSRTLAARSTRALLAVASALDQDGAQALDPQRLEGIQQRGYLTPDEDESLRQRYANFLVRRAALLQILEATEAEAGHSGRSWRRAPEAFLAALAAGLLLVRATRGWIELAHACRPIRKALDLADERRGVDRKTFARQYRATTRLSRLGLLRLAREHFRARRAEFSALPEAGADGPLLDFLDAECARRPDPLGRAALAARWRYRWFSFRRRHHSAWKAGEFTLFRWSGQAIADLRQPGRRPSAGKRVTEALRERARQTARPGDVFVTRHDDALSNLFLPGFWPHAALYFGEAARNGEGDFLEARKDGVLFRPLADTLQVDAFIILRPPLEEAEIAAALDRARPHAGKPYDFVFDFRHSERLACTEVVYRGFHGVGKVRFDLVETAGRLCLPAEELIQQALQQGFRVVAACGIGSGGWLSGRAAELALHQSRCGL
ncbi:YiiX/YebB-like N1pC/P60 family cysteine hydrolase [Haloferula sargassicola]|uniref:Permuted papain-like amidase YaeF/Yiix C92 family enzyme n=1 Tax=Haloferula sargassicola TaxID=490096 RepID=A0ABP9ULK7_9BACT